MTCYTTQQAARQLHVSFVTVKRWIYSGKIRASKNSRGWWCVGEEEIARLRAELSRRSSKRIDGVVAGLVFSKGVAYLREMQVCLEEEYLHEDTYAALQRLCSSKLKTAFELDSRWYFPRNKQWSDVQSKAVEKKELMNTYVSHPRRFEKEGVVYMDYSEYLVESALLNAGYTVVARDTYYFNGITYRVSDGAGRPKDLDFIAKIPRADVFVGVQVKNKMQHPTFDDVSSLLEICRVLHLKPMLIGRIIHPSTYEVLKSNEGLALKFKRYLLQPPFDRGKFPQIVEMGIPLGVYMRCPEFLVEMLLRAKDSLSS
jgi:excisionase family DNA binding protein